MTPYFSFADYTRRRFGTTAGKISIDIGAGCAHQKKNGGCSYCSLAAFTPSYAAGALPIEDQWQQGKRFSRHEKNYAYLQLGTNTGPGIDIGEKLAPILSDISLCGIMIGTRPDALDDASLSALASLGDHLDVWIEMGMQSADDTVLQRVNRGHTFSDFSDAVDRIRHFGTIKVSAHVIFGLPGESRDSMLSGIRMLGALAIDGVKFHQLAVVRDTPLADEYAVHPFPLLSEDAYAAIAAEALTLLPPTVVIERLVGDSHDDALIAPRWKASKHEVLVMIRSHLAAMGKEQGSCWRPYND